ncbi:21275_t:CDS:2, partial [Gigaspora margarita]
MAERANNQVCKALQDMISSLDILCQSTLPEIYNTKSSCISCKESGTLSQKDCEDEAKYTISSPDNKSLILKTKRENCEVHVQCLNSFRTSDKGDVEIFETNTRNKSEKHIDITAKFKACSNQTTIENLQASFGLTQDTRRTTDDQGSMSLVSKYDEQNDAFCNNIFMVVDTYANDSDRCNIASFIGCELPSDSRDPI